MAERDLVMTMGTRLNSDGDRALRQIGRAATEAKRPVDTLFRETTERARALSESAKYAGDSLAGAARSGQRELDRLLRAIQSAQKAYGELSAKADAALKPLPMRGGDRGLGGAVHSALGEASALGGIMGLSIPTTALAAFAASVKLADAGVKNFYSSIERGQFRMGNFEDIIFKSLNNTPIVGSFLEHQSRAVNEQVWSGKFLAYGLPALLATKAASAFGIGGLRRGAEESTRETQRALHPERYLRDLGVRSWRHDYANDEALRYLTYDQRKYRLFLAQQGHHLQGALAGNESRLVSGRDEQTRRQAMAEMETATALGQRRRDFGVMREAAQAGAEAILGVQGHLGYARATQLEDVTQAIGFREQHERQKTQAMARRSMLATQLQQAEEQLVGRQARVAKARQREDATAARLSFHLRSGGGPGVRGSIEEEKRLRDEHSAAAAARQKAEESQAEALNRLLDARTEKLNAEKEIQKQIEEISKSQLDTLNKQIEGEQRKIRGQQEQLGLLHPMTLRTLTGIQRKSQAGLPLTYKEQAYLQGHNPGGLFDSRLQQIAQQQATQGITGRMIQELMRGENVGGRMEALQQQRQALTAKIDANINIDTNSITDELMRRLVPQISQALIELYNSVHRDHQEAWNRALAERRAMFPQF